jgi:hypothetical protein
MRDRAASRAAVVSLVSLLLVACGDYTIALSDGYQLMRTSGGGEFILLSPQNAGGEVLVGPSVTAYRDLQGLVVGRVENPVGGGGHGYRLGYFIVDKTGATVSWGLSRREWEDRLREHGVAESVNLKKPNRFHAWF